MSAIYSLKSYSDYVGSSFHGVFSSKEKAKKAARHLRDSGFETFNYEITKLDMDTVFVEQCSDLYPTTKF